MITLQDAMDLLRSSDMIRVQRDQKTVYAGYKGLIEYSGEDGLTKEDYGAHVTRFAAVPEIRHKEYKKLGLMEPMRPDIMQQYSFADLRMTIYYEIGIEGGMKQ